LEGTGGFAELTGGAGVGCCTTAGLEPACGTAFTGADGFAEWVVGADVFGSAFEEEVAVTVAGMDGVAVAAAELASCAVAPTPSFTADGIAAFGVETKRATAATPIVPPIKAAAMAARTTPRDDRVGNDEAVIGADVTPAPGTDTASVTPWYSPVAGNGVSSLEVGPRRALKPAASASPSANSEAREKRRCGSRSKARANHASNEGGSPGSVSDGVGMGPVQILTRRSPTLSPSNGKIPVTHL
jgi:hypothetical protein